MKKLKMSLIMAAVALFTTTTIVSLNGCKSDPCKDETCNDNGTPTEKDKKTCECDCKTGFFGDKCNLECKNGGTSSDGLTCTCATGYEGTNCETEMRTKFIGSYSYTESCTSGNDVYSVGVSTSSTGVDKISISNLYNAGIGITATVNGTALTIATQTFGTGTISGTGSISGSTMTLTYTVVTGAGSDTCGGSGTK